MQIYVTIKNINSISLPIAYHHIQQSAIYSLISDNLHDQGVKYGKRDYKLFTFGPFTGRYTVNNRKITFYDSISFEFRCYDNDVMNNVITNLKKYGFRLGDVTYHNVDIELKNNDITKDKMVIKMISPICVYTTDEFKHTHYHSPGEDIFFSLVKDNFVRKYAATFGEVPKLDISLKPEKITEKDKYFTKYKNFYIEAWKGRYILEGNPDGLKFLYNTGIGAKNSQGFGMFEIV